MSICIQEIPDYLYQFKKPSLERIRQIVVHDEMFFPSSERFNDPFESSKTVRFPDSANLTLQDKEDLARLWTVMKTYMYPDKDEASFQAQVPSEIREGQHLVPANIRAMQAGLNEATTAQAKTNGICCLSGNLKHVLLWSHYADGHKGIAFEFNAKKLISASGKKSAVPVTYGDIPTLHELMQCFSGGSETDQNSEEAVMAIFRLMYCRKHIDWKYENEWRLFALPPDTYKPIDDGTLTGIIFGCRTDPKVKEEIIRYVRESSKSLRFFTARPVPYSFDLDIVPDNG